MDPPYLPDQLFLYLSDFSTLSRATLALLRMAGSFDPYEWRSFYFQMGRDEANKVLSQDGILQGTFLLRDSRQPGEKSLSVRESDDEQKVRHYLIQNAKTETGADCVKIAEQTFTELPMLLNHFKMRILDKTSLLYPYRKSEIEKVVALYRFETDKEEELGFEAGEELEIIGKPETEWWQARNALNCTGLIPSNYVEPATSEDGLHRISSTPSSSGSTNERFSGLSALSGADTDENYEPSLPAYAVVVFDRRPNAYDSSALRLKKGDQILVLKKLKNGLCEGVIDGKRRGTFPHTYVRWLPQESGSDPQSPAVTAQ